MKEKATRRNGKMPHGKSKTALLIAVFAILGLNFLSPVSLSACAMSAILCRQGFTLQSFPIQGFTSNYWDYNDPWDYFSFLMANSSEFSNADGYGVVAYQQGNPRLSMRNAWFKRVVSSADFGTKFYTGEFLSYQPNSTAWQHDILDEALFTLQSDNRQAAIAMLHARAATGVTYGNHPFVFHLRERSFSFMHNGNCNPARAFMIARINQQNPGFNWFARYPSNHFSNPNPLQWVDTEVFFHYIVSNIIAKRMDVLLGLHAALCDLTPFFSANSGVYNFVMSDGEKLYIFRSTPTNGNLSHYKLSYKEFQNRFYGVRTQSPYPGDVELNGLELVVLSSDTRPLHYPDITSTDFQRSPEEGGFHAEPDSPLVLVPSLQICPNPVRTAQDRLFVKLQLPEVNKTELAILQVYNLKGQSVYKQEFSGVQSLQNLELSLPELPTGIYLCHMILGNQTAKTKFTIVK